MDSLLLAAEPGTPSATLAALAASGDEAIRRAVAANPNTPAEALWSLAAKFPAEVTGNPTLVFVLIDEPGALRGQPLPVHLALAGCLSTPRPWLATLAEEALASNSPDLAFRLAANPSTSPDDLVRFCGHRNRHVRALAAGNPSISVEWLALLERAGSQRDGMDFCASTGELSAAEAHQLQAVGYWGQLLLARHPATPPELRERLADMRRGWSWREIRQAVAACPATPAELLERLATHREHEESVAANPSLPIQWLERLSRSPIGAVRQAAAGNPSTPAASLRLLATELDRVAAARAAANPGLDLRWRELIVKAGLTAEPGDPESLDDEDFPQLSTGGVRARRLVASHEKTPFSLLQALLADPDVWVRCALASRETLPGSLRAALLDAPDALVRAAIASRADLATDTIDLLCADRSPLVRCRLAANLALSDDQASRALTALLARQIPGDKHERQALLDALIRRPAGPALLARLLARADPKLRGQMARHPRLPPGLSALTDAPGGAGSFTLASCVAERVIADRNPARSPRSPS